MASVVIRSQATWTVLAVSDDQYFMEEHRRERAEMHALVEMESTPRRIRYGLASSNASGATSSFIAPIANTILTLGFDG